MWHKLQQDDNHFTEYDLCPQQSSIHAHTKVRHYLRVPTSSAKCSASLQLLLQQEWLGWVFELL